MFTKSNKRSGFSLLELAVALGLGIILAAIVVTDATAGFKQVKVIAQQKQLSSNATFLMGTLQSKIKQGVLFTLNSTSSLTILYPDLSTTTISLITSTSTGAVILNAATSSALTTNTVVVKNLAFTIFAKSVRVHFDLQSANASTTLSATTTFAQRNQL